MAISRIYKRTAGQLIEEALRDARIIPAQQPVQSYELQNGLEALNKVCKNLQTEGLHLWLLERAVLPLNPGQEQYSLGPDGDPCGYEDSFHQTELTADADASDLVITVKSTLGMKDPEGILEYSPVASVGGWEAVNNATLSVSSGLVIANNGATAGGSRYVLPTQRGKTYSVRFSYSPGTSASCTFSVLKGGVIADSITASTMGGYELRVVASGDSVDFLAQNVSTIAGQTSRVTSLQYCDLYSGSRIGVKSNDNTREWNYVSEVLTDTTVRLIAPVGADSESGNTVLSFSRQIDRPLQLFNGTYASNYRQSEIPINRWSRQEYTQQPIKGSQGMVVNWYYNPTLNDGKFYAWQTASNADNVVRFDVRKPLAVYSEVTDILDVPEEYLMYLKWAVAADLGPGYGVPDNRQVLLEQKAQHYLELALGNDNELDSIFIAPNYTGA